MPTVIAMGFLAVTLAVVRADEPKTPEEQFRALERAHDAAFQAWRRAEVSAKTEAESAAAGKLPGRNPRSFADGFMTLARKYPRTEAAQDALVWVGSHVMFGPETEEAKRRLLSDHVESAKLAPVFAFSGSPVAPRRPSGSSAARWLGIHTARSAGWPPSGWPAILSSRRSGHARRDAPAMRPCRQERAR